MLYPAELPAPKIERVTSICGRRQLFPATRTSTAGGSDVPSASGAPFWFEQPQFLSRVWDADLGFREPYRLILLNISQRKRAVEDTIATILGMRSADASPASYRFTVFSTR